MNQTEKKNIKNIFLYLKPQKLHVGLLFILTLLASVFDIVIPLLFGKTIDNVLLNNSVLIKKSFLMIILFTIFTVLLNSLQAHLSSKIINTLELNVKEDIFRNIINMKMERYKKFKIGSMIERMESDIGTFSHILVEQIIDILINIITVILVFVILVRINVTMTLVMSIMFPLLIFINYQFGIIIKKINIQYKKEKDDYINIMQESFVGIKTIRIYNMYSYICKKWSKKLELLFSYNMKIVDTLIVNSILFKMFNYLAYFSVIGLGIHLVISNKMTIGTFITYNTYIGIYSAAILELSQIGKIINQTSVSINRVVELKEDYELENINTVSNKVVEDEKLFIESVRIENLNFEYTDSDFSLNNINLNFYKDMKNYLVGNNGSGKSTIFDILTLLQTNYRGDVYIGDINIKTLNEENLLNNITLVNQEDFFFSDTIYNNLFAYKDNISKDYIERVCDMVGIHNYIMTLPNKYNTVFNENTFNMSKGQRQKLSIARGLLRGSKIFLLDEATSSLDIESENNIAKLIDRLYAKYVFIIITHKGILFDANNNIAVIENGKILNVGEKEYIRYF